MARARTPDRSTPALHRTVSSPGVYLWRMFVFLVLVSLVVAVLYKQLLEAMLNKLDPVRTIAVVRAFSYFLHLVNIAEDTCPPGSWNRSWPGESAAGHGDLFRALARAKNHGISGARLVEWFAKAVVAPVLTAHPTEVQRQSILDCERRIASLLALPADHGDPSLRAQQELSLRREVLRLWLTAMLRLTRLTVADEIENGLTYFRITFLEQLPRLYADLEAAQCAPW